MAENTIWVPASPAACWAVVADPRSYAFWVVGSDRVHGVEGDWPSVGATFHHAQGSAPLRLNDTTTVIACEPPRLLRLEVRARPVFVGIVTLTFTPKDDGTTISLGERAVGGLVGIPPAFTTDPFIRLRNAESVRRLSAMAWARQHV